jgi:transcriptional regulator with XRE-family HTH domain
MRRKRIAKIELAKKAGVSVSFISDMTTLKGDPNPSIQTMGKIADALAVPLPLLLLDPKSEVWKLLEAWSGAFAKNLFIREDERGKGMVEVTAIVPRQKAFVVRQWAEKKKNG